MMTVTELYTETKRLFEQGEGFREVVIHDKDTVITGARELGDDALALDVDWSPEARG